MKTNMETKSMVRIAKNGAYSFIRETGNAVPWMDFDDYFQEAIIAILQGRNIRNHLLDMAFSLKRPSKSTFYRNNYSTFRVEDIDREYRFGGVIMADKELAFDMISSIEEEDTMFMFIDHYYVGMTFNEISDKWGMSKRGIENRFRKEKIRMRRDYA